MPQQKTKTNNRNRINTAQKLQTLCNQYGMDSMEMLEQATFDSVSPEICCNPNNPECNYSINVEPDCTQGYCEECEQGTVKSAAVLAGII